MPISRALTEPNKMHPNAFGGFATWGMFWLLLASIGAAVFFSDGLGALLNAWQLPEYSHGPLIPILSGLLFLRQLKEVPIQAGPVRARWVGITVLLFALMLGTLGRLANIADIVAYALILWVGGILLISWGWKQGRQFWPPVLHLVYMLPLPGVIYYKLSTFLQFVSSELGVVFLQLLNVPVFLEGNIIDFGVFKLHVAEACSGLRYLFPILSFSYIFAVLYKGPIWHKAVLLISAAPITVFMNSLRIAIAGVLVNRYGIDSVEGFSHFFEGWVIFIACIALLFLLARFLLFFQPLKMGLAESLDLDIDGLGTQALRLRLVQNSGAMVAAAVIMVIGVFAWQLAPERQRAPIERETFALFPRQLGDWGQIGLPKVLSPGVRNSLGADDYHQIDLSKPGDPAGVGLFIAWYADQSQGGVHSPEICLPSSGWEIAWLERSDITNRMGWDRPFNINRAIIQKGETRMMVYYWFEQKGRKVAWDFAAKFYLLVDGITTGRTDGALVRLTTIILDDETDNQAEVRLNDVLDQVILTLPRFVPDR
ncbi:MAG: VPLPA-CTERM-specific exosortase XrtD [Paracoccaceae bacterium]